MSHDTDHHAVVAWTWRHVAALVGLAVVVVVAYWDTVVSMVALWEDGAYQHCYLVPVISLGLLWRERRSLDGRWTGSWLGVAAVVASVWIWVVARVSLLQAAEHLALILMFVCLVWSVVGTREFRRLRASQLYLLLMLPIGSEIVPYLMVMTADIAAFALNLAGFPVLREGMYFTLPGGAFEIAGACSGLRYITAGVATAILVALLSFTSVTRRVVFVLVVVMALMIVNGIRAFTIMAIASSTNMSYLAGEDHVVFGWALYAVAIGTLCWLALRFSDRQVSRAH